MHKRNNAFGPRNSPETTPGGQALKYYSSVRLDVRRIGKVTAGDQTIGNRTRVRVIKNKVAIPFNDAEFDIRWGVGVDRATDLLDTAVELGVVTKHGAHYQFGGSSFAHGREKAREALLGQAELCDKIRTATNEIACAVFDSESAA